MTLTGPASFVWETINNACKKVKADIDSSADGLKKLHAMRLADEKHKEAWKQAETALNRAKEVLRRLNHLHAALTLASQVDNDADIHRENDNSVQTVTLSAEECALLSYVSIAVDS